MESESPDRGGMATVESGDQLRQARKRRLFEEWMKGDHVLVHLDSRRKGVSVPAHLENNPTLTLKLSYLFQSKTTVSDDAINSFLKFSGSYFECILPWDAIWGMTNDASQNQVWPEDLPKEVVASVSPQPKAAVAERTPAPPAHETIPAEPSASKRQPPVLKRIK